MAATETTERPVDPASSPVRERFWFQGVVVVVALAAFALLATRFVHRDVVSGWQVVATCPAGPAATSGVVRTTLDTSACATPPTDPGTGRGWPIVPVVLPAAAGLDPAITTVSSDTRTRTFRVDYAAPSASVPNAGGTVIVFVEVPPAALPATPFTVQGASGPVTVTSVQTG